MAGLLRASPNQENAYFRLKLTAYALIKGSSNVGKDMETNKRFTSCKVLKPHSRRISLFFEPMYYGPNQVAWRLFACVRGYVSTPL